MRHYKKFIVGSHSAGCTVRGHDVSCPYKSEEEPEFTDEMHGSRLKVRRQANEKKDGPDRVGAATQEQEVQQRRNGAGLKTGTTRAQPTQS